MESGNTIKTDSVITEMKWKLFRHVTAIHTSQPSQPSQPANHNPKKVSAYIIKKRPAAFKCIQNYSPKAQV